jgi:hypothetical protein
LVIAVRQRLAAGKPQALDEKHGEQSRRNALRQIKAKTAKDTEPVDLHALGDPTSLNSCAEIPFPTDGHAGFTFSQSKPFNGFHNKPVAWVVALPMKILRQI